jgi:NADPH-dependent glutamate synthase beta subunit-like oxidoreductase
MVSGAIPAHFRLTDPEIARDIERIRKSGVNIIHGVKVDEEKFNRLRKDYKYVFIGIGAQVSKKLRLEGCDAQGVLDPLVFLKKARHESEFWILEKMLL